jgi:hypothetical protein
VEPGGSTSVIPNCIIEYGPEPVPFMIPIIQAVALQEVSLPTFLELLLCVLELLI